MAKDRQHIHIIRVKYAKRYIYLRHQLLIRHILRNITLELSILTSLIFTIVIDLCPAPLQVSETQIKSVLRHSRHVLDVKEKIVDGITEVSQSADDATDLQAAHVLPIHVLR